jgi:hypothetical protein
MAQWSLSECQLVARQRGLKIRNDGHTWSLLTKDGIRYASNMSYARLQATLKRLDREEMERLERESLHKIPKEKLVDMVISYRGQIDNERKSGRT